MRELERMQDDVSCMQRCMHQIDTQASCESSCKAEKAKERSAAEAARQRAFETAPAPEEDSSMSVMLFPLVVGAAFLSLVGLMMWFRQRADRAWASGVLGDGVDWSGLSSTPAVERDTRARFPTVAKAFDALASKDEAFSLVLFEDFAHTLYVEAHTLRGKHKLAQLDPYLGEEAMMVLRTAAAEAVSTIIVGGQRIEEVRGDTTSRRLILSVRFTANYTERSAGRDQGYYVEELWTFSRDADLRSRPPERSRVIDCPSCGAPLDKIVAGKCKYCNAATAAGSHDWRVDRIRIEAKEPRGPMLYGTTEEVGTDLPTVVSPDLKERYAALTARDPALTWLAFTQRVTAVFDRFYQTWSEQDLRGVRPFLSDNLFESQGYWIAAYKAEGLRNIAGEPQIAAIHLSRVTSDKYFDAITVRVYASCFDYTLNAEQRMVGGSRTKRREYSEYWTFIRGVDKTGTPKVDDTCPNCGAPAAEINMAGECNKCRAKISNGSFDWVLSRIEQDEVFVL